MKLINAVFCVVVLFAWAIHVQAETTKLNLRPIIGVVTQPRDELQPEKGSYLPASYVKWLESAGARVAVVFVLGGPLGSSLLGCTTVSLLQYHSRLCPRTVTFQIPYNAPKEKLQYLFNSVNGVLFTGGGLSLQSNTTYYQTAQFIFQSAINAYHNKDYFPLWGTCMGFQLLTILGAQDHSVLEEYAFDSENLPLPLVPTPAAATSRLFGKAPAEVWSTLTTQPATMNLHHDGIDPSTYSTNQKLANLYNLLSTNVDRKHKPFGSTLEGKVYPFYATQWHGERNEFEWGPLEKLLKTPAAIRAMQYIADFFVTEVRNNHHKFPTVQEETAALIYNYAPTYTGDDTSDDTPDQQTYYFNLTM